MIILWSNHRHWPLFPQSTWLLAFITSHKLAIQKIKESVSRVEMYKAQTTVQLSVSTKPWLLCCLPLCLWLALYSSSINNLISYESLKPGVVAHSCNPRIYEAEAGLPKSSRPTEATVKFCLQKVMTAAGRMQLRQMIICRELTPSQKDNSVFYHFVIPIILQKINKIMHVYMT